MRSPAVLPPMYRWPRPVKFAVLGFSGLLCLAAYAALFGSLYGLMVALAEAVR
jgi:hypothetical protein